MQAAKTAIIGNFPGHKKPAKRPPNFVDINTLSITNDPLPQNRLVSVERKYESLLKKMKPGQCVVCEPEAVGQIAGAMRNYIKRESMKDHIVKTVMNYQGTGKGRVWMLFVGPKGGEA